MRYVERVAEAAWEQGQRRPFYISNWMAVTLRTRLTKDNLTLAHKLLDLYAAAQMIVSASGERVDCANGQAIRQDAAVDAMRALEGYAQAVRSTAGARCALALRCLWEGGTMNDLLSEMRLKAGSYGYAVALVQRAMASAQEYDDGIVADYLTGQRNSTTNSLVPEIAPGQPTR